jgi:hypothetical protein
VALSAWDFEGRATHAQAHAGQRPAPHIQLLLRPASRLVEGLAASGAAAVLNSVGHISAEIQRNAGKCHHRQKRNHRAPPGRTTSGGDNIAAPNSGKRHLGNVTGDGGNPAVRNYFELTSRAFSFQAFALPRQRSRSFHSQSSFWVRVRMGKPSNWARSSGRSMSSAIPGRSALSSTTDVLPVAWAAA